MTGYVFFVCYHAWRPWRHKFCKLIYFMNFGKYYIKILGHSFYFMLLNFHVHKCKNFVVFRDDTNSISNLNYLFLCLFLWVHMDACMCMCVLVGVWSSCLLSKLSNTKIGSELISMFPLVCVLLTQTLVT